MFEITIPTDTEDFRNWLRFHLSMTPTAPHGLSDEFDEGEIDGDTYFGIRGIDGQPRPIRGHPVTIRVEEQSRDRAAVTIFHLSDGDDGDFATFAGFLAEALCEQWQVRIQRHLVSPEVRVQPSSVRRQAALGKTGRRRLHPVNHSGRSRTRAR